MRYIRTLAQIHRGEHDLVGQRARDLALLSQKEFSTPLSFALTNDAFEAFIHQNNLQERIGTVLMEESTGTRRYDQIRELILNGEYSKEMVQELVEAYESLSEGDDLITSQDAAFVNVILSPNHTMPDENREGIILNVRGLEQLLLAIKECWACLFTPGLQRHRANAGITVKNLNVGVLIERMERGEITAETWSATGGDKNVLTVKAYYGAIDIHGTVEKDELRVSREFLKPTYQSVAIQTVLLTLDEDDRLAKLPLGARGEEQTLNDRDMIELARLTKKASGILDEQVKLYFAVQRQRMSVLLCTGLLLTAGSVKLDGFTEEEPIEEEPSATIPVEEAPPETDAESDTTTERSLGGSPSTEDAEPEDTEPEDADYAPEGVEADDSTGAGVTDAEEQTTESDAQAEESTTMESSAEVEAGGPEEEYSEPEREQETTVEERTATESAEETSSPEERAEAERPDNDEAADADEQADEPDDESIFSGVEPLAQGYERVKEALQRAYADRFKGVVPESPKELFFELSSEVTLPHEQEIGLLVRIMEEDEEYDEAQEEAILEAIDDFCNRV